MSKKHTYEFVKGKFDERGLELIETEYINSKTKMAYKCLIHPTEIQKISYNNLSKGHGCNFCAIERNKDALKLDYEYVKNEFVR